MQKKKNLGFFVEKFGKKFTETNNGIALSKANDRTNGKKTNFFSLP